MRHPVIHHTINLKNLRVYRPGATDDGHVLSFALFDTGLSAHVAQEILNGNAYPLLPDDVLPADSVTTIYDVGANIGASCVYWCDSYPHAKVYAYEPGLDAYELLCENTAGLPVEPYHVALASANGEGTLYHNVEDDVCNSLQPHKHSGSEQVRLERARQHINSPIDIMKIDTEGSECEILADVEAWFPDIKVIYLEYHSECDRLRLTNMLDRTHTLWRSNATRPHRGELCYLRNDLLIPKYNDWAILDL